MSSNNNNMNKENQGNLNVNLKSNLNKSGDSSSVIEMAESKFGIDNLESNELNSPNKKKKIYTNLINGIDDISRPRVKDNLLTDTEVGTEAIGYCYNSNNTQEKFKRFMLFVKLLPTLIGTILYLITLQGCNKPFYICVNTFEREYVYPFIVPYVITASGCFYIQFAVIRHFLIDNTKKSQLYYLIPWSMIIFLFFIDKGAGFDRHGLYNFMILTAFLGLFCLIEKIILSFLNLLKKYLKVVLIVTATIITIITAIYLNIKPTFDQSCAEWKYGLKNTTINNDDTKCVLKQPDVCLMQVFNGWFNYSYWTNSTCESLVKGDYLLVQEILTDKTAKIIGYPRTNNWDYLNDSRRKFYNTKVRKNIINMEDPNIPQSEKDLIETIVDFNFNPAKVTLDLKFNHTLAEKRNEEFKKQNAENTHPIIANNILTFYIDSLSRPDFRRKLPNFYKYIEKYYRSTDNEEYESFQFFKYHGVGRYTLLNNIPAFWGTYSLQTEKGRFYLENVKKRGFVTGSAQNHCAKETVASDDVPPLQYSGYDHELNGFYCDPNNESPNNTLSNFHGSNSIVPRCLYGKHTGEYNMDYALQFFDKYKDNAKLFHLGLMDNHEATAEGIVLLDHKIVKFFQEFESRGYLKNTTVIIQTDHGHAFFSFYNVVQSKDQRKELTLPSLFIIMPKNNTNNFKEIRKTLIDNENSFISPFTIYNSYQTLVGYEKENVALYSIYNIFKDKIPHTLNCSQFYDKEYFKIAEYLCSCENNTKPSD